MLDCDPAHDDPIGSSSPSRARRMHGRIVLRMLLGETFGIPLVPGETTEVDIVLTGGIERVAEMRVVETEWEGEVALLASLRDASNRRPLRVLCVLCGDVF